MVDAYEYNIELFKYTAVNQKPPPHLHDKHILSVSSKRRTHHINKQQTPEKPDSVERSKLMIASPAAAEPTPPPAGPQRDLQSSDSNKKRETLRRLDMVLYSRAVVTATRIDNASIGGVVDLLVALKLSSHINYTCIAYINTTTTATMTTTTTVAIQTKHEQH